MTYVEATDELVTDGGLVATHFERRLCEILGLCPAMGEGARRRWLGRAPLLPVIETADGE